MDHNKLSKNFINLFNKNLMLRIMSALILVPLFIFTMLIGGWIIIIFYLFIITIINLELKEIYNRSVNKYIIIFYFLLANISLLSLPIYFFSKDSLFIPFLFIIFSIWVFDTFSFLGGSFFRGKKIFPKISSGKTYSGLLSGFLSLLILNFALLNFLKFSLNNIFFYVLLIGLCSFVGDTLVSIIKRSAKIKDTGNILPGHGGVLDRMDSFIFVFFIIIIFDLINIL